jgi:phosphonate transport system ATP-binding protein
MIHLNELNALSKEQRPAVELRDVWYSYDGRSYILRGIDLKVLRGSSLMILGSSGSGKTTLLKIMCGLLKPSKGSVSILGAEVTDPSNGNHIRRQIGYIPQQLGLVRSLTVLENVLMGALPRMGFVNSLLSIYPKSEVEFAEQCLGVVGLSHKAGEKVYRLSGGERQRVAIARALMQKSRIILADEFISELDYVRAREVMDIMSNLRREGVTLICVTHDVDIAAEYGENAVILRGGEKVVEISARKLTPDLLKESFNED